MERNASDITLFAKLGFLVYVDGYMAKIAGMKPSKNQQDEDVWDFVLDPSDELIKRYNLTVNAQGNMLYRAQLPYEMVIQLNADPAWTRWFYLKTFDSKSTPEVRKLEGFGLKEEIQRLNKKLREEKMKVEVAEEKLHLMEIDMPKYLKRNFAPMIDQLTPILEKMNKKDDN